MERIAVKESEFGYQSNDRPMRLWEPNEFLLEVVPELRPGSAIDFACGGGRETASMAYFGWNVTGIDILPDALIRAEALATRFGVANNAQWCETDLTKWSPSGPIDLAAMFFYLDRPLIANVVATLAPGGSLMLETFSPTHREIHGKPSRSELVISAGEMSSLAAELEIVHCTEGFRSSGRHTCRFWGRKRF